MVMMTGYQMELELGTEKQSRCVNVEHVTELGHKEEGESNGTKIRIH